MVNFICDACGQTIKKQRVEKHYQTECRGCSVLSCIDCGKDFPGDSYVSHTSCISEAEKYQGKLYKAKEKENKGERKQQEWLEQVRSASGDGSSQDPRVRKLMAKIISYSNVPRKEVKFKKFCENSVNIRDQALLEKLWRTFSAARNSNVSNNSTNDTDQNLSKNLPEENMETTSSGENGTTENSENKTVESMDQEESKPDESLETNRKESKREKKKKRKMETEGKEQVNRNEEDGENVKRKNRKKRKIEEQTNSNEEGTAVGHKKKKKRKYEAVETEQNGIEKEHDVEIRKKKKKSKNLENIEPNTLSTDREQGQDETGQDEQTVETQEKFRWEAVIKKVLKSAPDNEMGVKKLRKKVINEFLTRSGDPRPRSEQELRALFEKKLHKNPKVKVHKEKAKYCK